MRLRALHIGEVIEIVPSRHEDERGYLAETFREDWFGDQVAAVRFVQENQSVSHRTGVVRGLHCQLGTSAQGKLVRCLAGAVFDVAVDIRRGSASYGQWVAATLTAAEGNQLWIPPGFLHGFCTLGPEVSVAYKVTHYHDRAAERGVRWDDPDIGIAWPAVADAAQLSGRDRQQPRLRDWAEGH